MSKSDGLLPESLNYILVADRTHRTSTSANLELDDLEKIDDGYFNDLYEILQEIGNKTIHAEGPEELAELSQEEPNSLALTVYGGQKSRNRMALVPATCEVHNIKYIGADVYARVICQDKHLCKKFCEDHGALTPNSVVFKDKVVLEAIQMLNLPLVVKPNFEGSSIGIDNSSLVTSYQQAYNKSSELITKFSENIIIEEFIPGKEVSISIIGDENDVHYFEAVAIEQKGQPDYFDSHLLTAHEKRNKWSEKHFVNMNNDLSEETISIIKNIFLSLGKLDYMRIDAKLYKNKLYIIELTPDAHLGEKSQFAQSFILQGMTYKSVIKNIIEASLVRYQSQYAND